MARYRRIAHLASLVGRRSDAEMDEEIDAHLQLRVDDLVRRGWTLQAARVEAARHFGDLEAARRQLRAGARRRDAATRHREHVSAIVADARLALRRARNAPGFTTLTLCTLALGLGLTIAIFTLVRGVLLRPLPLAEPSRLVALSSVDSLGRDIVVVSAGNWQDWRRESRTLSGIALHFEQRVSITDTEGAERVSGQIVSGNFFDVLRPRLLVGRPFTDTEAQARAPVVVISEGLWRRVLGADTGLVRKLRVGSRSMTVVGVVRAGGEYPEGTELWLPVPFGRETGAMRNNINWYAVGRLAPRATFADAKRDLDRIALDIHRREPEALYSYGVGIQPLQARVVGGAATYLPLLAGAVVFVLVIVCANIASATLARGATRTREMAMRAALGAGRGRLVQQLLIEHVMLALIAAILGAGIASGFLWFFVHRWGVQIPRVSEVRIDVVVYLFAAGLAIVVGLLAGVLPALRGSRASLTGLLASGSRHTASGGRGISGAGLVVAELATALVLLTGAGLLIQSFRVLLARDLGFDLNGVTVQASLTGGRYATAGARLAYWRGLEDALRAVPGVRAAGVANWVPLGMGGTGFIEVEGKTLVRPDAGYRVVSAGYFDALGVSLLAGRGFDARDDSATVPVVVVNRRTAELYWPGESPLGRRMRASSNEQGPHGTPAPWRTVIGVVADIRHWGLEAETGPEMYVPIRQAPANWTWTMTAVARGAIPAEQLVAPVRARARVVDPGVATDVALFEATLASSLAERRMTLSIVTVFGGVALLLAAVGIYAVLGHAVSARKRELAVRAALGARRSQLLAIVLFSALRIIAVGIAIGAAAAWAATRVMASLLVDVTPHDPATFARAIVTLVAAAILAALVPAMSATRVDPARSLQSE